MSAAILGGICRRCLNFPSRYGCEVSNGTTLADGSIFYGPSAHWECRAPKDPPPPPTWEFPWPQPRSQYDTDGPDRTTTVHLPGPSGADAAIYRVTPTDDDGAHTARTRFCVECITCGEVLHPRTTGPSHRIRDHHRHSHGAEKR